MLQTILTDNINMEVFSGVINSRFLGFVQYDSYTALYYTKTKDRKRKNYTYSKFLAVFLISKM